MKVALAWLSAVLATLATVGLAMLIADVFSIPFSGESTDSYSVGGGRGSWETSGGGASLFAYASYLLSLSIGLHAYAAISRSPYFNDPVNWFGHITAGLAVSWVCALALSLAAAWIGGGLGEAIALAGFLGSLVLAYKVGKRVREIALRRKEVG
jgi:hypothetical protein